MLLFYSFIYIYPLIWYSLYIILYIILYTTLESISSIYRQTPCAISSSVLRCLYAVVLYFHM